MSDGEEDRQPPEDGFETVSDIEGLEEQLSVPAEGELAVDGNPDERHPTCCGVVIDGAGTVVQSTEDGGSARPNPGGEAE